MSSVDRATLEARLKAEGLEASAWSNVAGERFEERVNDFDRVVVVVEGSITYGLSGYGVGYLLTAGERLDLPANVAHNALVGPKGVTCLEAHVAAGTFGTRAKGRGYRW
jgi:quercetin dioxygenase-like cupin family protein